MSRVWFNGALVDGPISLDPRDRGFNLGDGLFETMLVVNAVPLWANMHLARMESAAQELGLAFDRQTVDSAIAAVLGDATPNHRVLRVTLSRGAGARGLGGSGASPSLVITCDPFDAALMFQPATLLTSTVRRSTASPAARMKTLSYIDNVVAAREANARAMDDALMLNTEGHVACSTIANIFMMKGRRIVTPSRDQGILTGVMRQALLASAQHLGFETEERAVRPSELPGADAVFLTNSLRFIRPVKSLDQHPLASAEVSMLIGALCESARLQCGRDPKVDLERPRD
jgi:branched-chain amino acid aminotransferase